MSNKIEVIKDIKLKLDRNFYKEGNILENDFKFSIKQVWDGLDDLLNNDLTDLFNIIEFLVKEVINIHKLEASKVNKEVLGDNINIRKIYNKLEDGKSALEIYSFNDNRWENYIVGDIHSDTISIDKILDKVGFYDKIAGKNKIRLILLGDYVDRGEAQLKVIQYILTLKYIFPENIFLQRGNHDGGEFHNNEVKMWVKRPEGSTEDKWFLLYLFNLSLGNKTISSDIIHYSLEFFKSLANISFLSYENRIFLLSHGGIPRPKKDEENPYYYLNNISDLTNEEIIDNIGRSISDNMRWSDPRIDDEDLNEGKARFKFTEENYNKFRELIGFDTLIRGHQVQKQGYKKIFHENIINIFSTGKIMSNNKDINTETAY